MLVRRALPALAAAVAISTLARPAHAIVRSAFHMLSRHEPYHELGGNDFDEHRREHLVDRLTRRIERLGYRVALEPAVTS